MNSTKKPSPIEVWLRLKNMQVACTVVRQDETTYELEIDSMSMRGAQRELTGYLLADGYKPVGRWVTESKSDERAEAEETSRRFRLADDPSSEDDES